MVRLRDEGTRIQVHIDDNLFTAYRFSPDQHLPYFYPLIAPDGTGVTIEFPAPYPHHRSLWLGHGNVNGTDFWKGGPKNGRIIHTGILWSEEGEEAILAVQAEWKTPEGQTLLTDERYFRFWGEGNFRFLDAEFLLRPEGGSVLLGRTNHALFSVRVHPSLSVLGGGRLRNSEGGINEAGTMGKEARWCLYERVSAGKSVGIAVFDHPLNPWHPPPWFTRDYGFFSPSPFYWREFLLTPDTTLRLRYRVVVFSASLDPEALWEAYAIKAIGEPRTGKTFALLSPPIYRS